MTARNYDVILTVNDATGFVPGNSVLGATSATVALIANVNQTTNELKVKLNNVLQEFHTSETVTSSASVVGGARFNTTVFTPILTITSISAADSDRTAATYAITDEDYTKTGVGTGATFSVVVNDSGAAAVTVTAGGDRFVVGDVITIADAKLGGGGAAALTFNVATTGGFSGTQFPTAITGITRANPGVVTIIEHGFTTGDRYYFTNVEGMTEVNGNIYTITVIDEDTFSIVNTTGFTAYSGTTGFVTFITTLTVADTSGINAGYVVNSPNSNGYTSSQTVTAVPSSTTLTISAPPNTIPNGPILFVDEGSTLTSVPFVSNIFISSQQTASATIASQAPSPFIAEKNAFTQNPIVRMYEIYYPGEWFPATPEGLPTENGEGRSWPTNFPLKFADIAGDLISDLNYNVTYDGESYIPFPVDVSSISQGTDGKINELTLTIFNVDNIISALVEDPFIVGNNTSNSCVANVNGIPCHGIDPRTINFTPAQVGNAGEIAFDTLTIARSKGLNYSSDIEGYYGQANASFTKFQTDAVAGTWQELKNDSRDLQGAVVNIKTTFANFLDVWPEHSSLKYVSGNVLEVYNSMPYRVGDKVRSSSGPTSATIQTIEENRFLFLSNDLESNTSIGDSVFIINDDVDTESYIEDRFKIDQLESLSDTTAAFGLVTWLQYFKQVTPRRKYYKNTCQWQYKGEECQYPGPAGGTIPGTELSANTNPIGVDNQTASGPEGDICGKNILACTIRNNSIHFGGFPATGRTIPKQ
jgi:phage-related protein|tara:strand:+ start:1662 stop:3938 length:2277 start_codon:yes stop_codon:yes gene_type:complete